MLVNPIATIDHAESPHFVYRFYNSDGEILYVGYTNSPSRRWSSHQRSKSWWSEVSYKSFDVYNSSEEALIAEAVQIRDLEPLYNVSSGQVHAYGWSMGENLRNDIDTFLGNIWKGRHALRAWKNLADHYKEASEYLAEERLFNAKAIDRLDSLLSRLAERLDQAA